MNRRIAVRAIIIKEGKLLCVRLQPNEFMPMNGTFWCVPGGGLEPGESLPQGLEREMVEETGIQPTIGNLVYIQQYKDEKHEYLEFLFAVTNSEDYEQIDLTKTTHGMAEIQEIAFIDLAGATILPKFLTERDIAQDIAAGTTQCMSYL
jgi:ADP-ribose pyrophosphatase YjhB (NUDIX family)